MWDLKCAPGKGLQPVSPLGLGGGGGTPGWLDLGRSLGGTPASATALPPAGGASESLSTLPVPPHPGSARGGLDENEMGTVRRAESGCAGGTRIPEPMLPGPGEAPGDGSPRRAAISGAMAGLAPPGAAGMRGGGPPFSPGRWGEIGVIPEGREGCGLVMEGLRSPPSGLLGEGLAFLASSRMSSIRIPASSPHPAPRAEPAEEPVPGRGAESPALESPALAPFHMTSKSVSLTDRRDWAEPAPLSEPSRSFLPDGTFLAGDPGNCLASA
mmetsp:Transcript_13505/g.33052  ORF Transcript_13505/g.33052 Transcript_13505/m.33052 type:complete len:270 (+) Transcript_13505:342-1151(+)